MSKYLLLLSTFLIANKAISQNVGIGVTIPSEKLHVAGNIKADSLKPDAIKLVRNAGIGKVLTSDAVGNANWQSSNVTGNVGFGVWGDCATNGNISEYNPVVDTSGALGDNFGLAVAISGHYAIIGSPLDDVNGSIDRGSASIYQHSTTGWILFQKLTDGSGNAGSNFGRSVSISGNYAIVGAFGDSVGTNARQGSASIYLYNGNSWVLIQKLIDAAGGANGFFGQSVSLSGNYAIVGAEGDKVGGNHSQGSASIYHYDGINWVLTQKITDATGNAGDRFGYSVSISNNYAIVGAVADDIGANINQGSAIIYQYNGTSWIEMQKLFDNTTSGGANDSFGGSVSISGKYAIIGEDSDDLTYANQGSASIYEYNDGNWMFMQKLIDAAGAANDHFGVNVSISGDYAIVGIVFDDVGINNNIGSAMIFLRVGNGWGRLQSVTDPMGNSEELLGRSTAIDSGTKRFVIGVYGYAGRGKAVFGKIN